MGQGGATTCYQDVSLAALTNVFSSLPLGFLPADDTTRNLYSAGARRGGREGGEGGEGRGEGSRGDPPSHWDQDWLNRSLDSSYRSSHQTYSLDSLESPSPSPPPSPPPPTSSSRNPAVPKLHGYRFPAEGPLSICRPVASMQYFRRGRCVCVCVFVCVCVCVCVCVLCTVQYGGFSFFAGMARFA